jgi:hypothetical protein
MIARECKRLAEADFAIAVVSHQAAPRSRFAAGIRPPCVSVCPLSVVGFVSCPPSMARCQLSVAEADDRESLGRGRGGVLG